MRFLPAILLLALAACDDAPPAATLKEIPAVFVGNWDAVGGDCSGTGASAVKVTLTEVAVSSFEDRSDGRCPGRGDGGAVDGHFTSADGQSDGSVRLEIGNGGQELNVVNGSALSPRVKMPVTRQLQQRAFAARSGALPIVSRTGDVPALSSAMKHLAFVAAGSGGAGRPCASTPAAKSPSEMILGT